MSETGCLKDVKCQNLEVEGTISGKRLSKPLNEKIAAARILVPEDHGKTFLLDASTSFAITLPTATTEAAAEALVGTHFRFVLDVDHASNDITIIRGDTTNDIITGNVVQTTDGARASAITVSSNIITFDASEAMGVGDYVDVICTHGTADTIHYRATGVASA